MINDETPLPTLDIDASNRLSFLINRTRKALEERKYDRAEQDLADRCNL